MMEFIMKMCGVGFFFGLLVCLTSPIIAYNSDVVWGMRVILSGLGISIVAVGIVLFTVFSAILKGEI